MAIALSFTLFAIFLVGNVLSVTTAQTQQPLLTVNNGKTVREIDLIHELKRAEIIPTVLDTFQPLLTISISWPAKNATVDYGNTINPTSVQEVPIISFVDAVPGSEDKHNTHPQLTLALTDPDAPSRDNPEWSQVCHWIITNVPLDSHSSGSNEDDFTESKHRMKEIMPYKSPGPPPKTGKHRYVFVALSPLNRTIETLDLVAPSDRRRWGFEEERKGLRTWMAEMGLGVVGANFMYAQNDEQ